MTDDEYIKVRVGSSRSATLRNIYRAVDERYSSGPVSDVQEPSDQSDEDIDGTPDSSGQTSLDAGEADGGLEGATDDQGNGEPSTEPSGGEVDEGTSGDPGELEEQVREPDVEQTTVKRVESTGGARSGEYGEAEYHGGPRSTILGIGFN